MIVLDVNVVSEAMKAAPNPAVLAWLDEQAAGLNVIDLWEAMS